MKIVGIKELLVILFIVGFYSCSSDSEDDITPPPTSGKITYNQHVKPAIDGNCLGCHMSPPVNGAPFPLTNYNEVSSRASSILTAISKQSSEPRAMPPGNRLPQTTIDVVNQWIQDGLLEN